MAIENNPVGESDRPGLAFLRRYGLLLLAVLVCNRLLLAWIGGVAVEAFAPHFYKPDGHVFSQNSFAAPWGGWDTLFYLQIATEGYVSPDGSMVQVGWFPLYSLAIKLATVLVPNAYWAALLVSNLCLLGAIALLGAWLAEVIGLDAAFRSVLFLIFFPTSMVLSGAFSESIFLLLLVAAFYLAHRGRNTGACVAFSLLLISRPMALPLAPFFLVALQPLAGTGWRDRVRRLAPLVLLPIPFLVYSWYLWRLTGDPLAYVHNKLAAGNDLAAVNPLAAVWSSLSRGFTEHRFEHFFNAGLVLFGTAAVLGNRRSLGWNYLLLGLVLIWFPLLLHVTILSSSRYLAVAVPLFSGLALGGERCRCTPGLYMVCLVLQGFVMVFWSTGSRFLM